MSWQLTIVGVLIGVVSGYALARLVWWLTEPRGPPLPSDEELIPRPPIKRRHTMWD